MKRPAPSLPLALAFTCAASVAGALALVPAVRADEGMWTYDNVPKDAIKKKYGFAITDPWLDHVRQSSVKFGGGCSASFVSPQGLIMTNHHCSRTCVQQVSSAKADYVANGFTAKTEADELKCPGLDVSVLLGIEDVTAKIAAATKGLDGQKFNDAQNGAKSKLEKECSQGDTLTCEVVSLYKDSLFHLYKYRRYTDVRLAFAPEAAIAFFGGDPDNFEFPRYDLDVSFLRAYQDGKPAKVEHFFKWSAPGAKEGDLVFVSGHPGSTQRLNTVAQLELARDIGLPNALKRIAELRGLLTQFQRKGPEQKRISQAMLFYLENSFKNLSGQHEALTESDFIEKKRAEEKALIAQIGKKPDWKKKYGGAWDAMAKSVALYKKVRKQYAFQEGGSAFSSDLFGYARLLVRAAEERGKPSEERFREFRDSALPAVERRLGSPAPVYKELDELTLGFSLGKLREVLGPDDPFVRKVLGKQSPEELAHALVSGSKLDDPAYRKKLWEGGKAAVAASTDPMIVMAKLVDDDARAIRKKVEDEIDSVQKKAGEQIGQALFALRGKSMYPDATGTLRLSYGAVKGYEENGRKVPAMTDMGGAYARATGKDPYALPKSWLDARTKLNRDTPFNFVSSNDIIGGNSGSPVIDKDAQIVGLVFDGNIQSLGGAYFFDESVNRTVAVASPALVEALRVIYKADRVVQELAPAPTAAK